MNRFQTSEPVAVPRLRVATIDLHTMGRNSRAGIGAVLTGDQRITTAFDAPLDYGFSRLKT